MGDSLCRGEKSFEHAFAPSGFPKLRTVSRLTSPTTSTAWSSGGPGGTVSSAKAIRMIVHPRGEEPQGGDNRA